MKKIKFCLILKPIKEEVEESENYVDSIGALLHQSILAQNDGSNVPNYLKTYQTYFNWLIDSGTFEADTKFLVEMTEDNLLNKPEDEMHIDLKYTAMELVASRGSTAYFKMMLKDFAAAETLIAEMEKILEILEENQYLAQEYLDGFRYVTKGLKVFVIMQEQLERVNTTYEISVEAEIFLRKEKEDMLSFQDLSVKSQVGAAALKYHFQTKFRPIFTDQFALLEKMIEVDPGNFEWHLYYYRSLRFHRQESGNFSGPSEKEKHALLQAVCLQRNHPMVLVDFCKYMSDAIKSIKLSGEWTQPLIFGPHICFSYEDAIEVVSRKARCILESYEQSVRVNIPLAEFFSDALPNSYRNYEFSKACIDRAFFYRSDCSRVNHLMALHSLKVVNNVDLAKDYCLKAVSTDALNFPALLDLIHIYLSKPIENAEKLEQILKVQSVYPFWNEWRRAYIQILQGCYYYMIDDDNARAVSAWTSAINIYPKIMDLFEFSSLKQQFGHSNDIYQWRKENLCAVRINELIKTFGRLTLSASVGSQQLSSDCDAEATSLEHAPQDHEESRDANNSSTTLLAVLHTLPHVELAALEIVGEEDEDDEEEYTRDGEQSTLSGGSKESKIETTNDKAE